MALTRRAAYLCFLLTCTVSVTAVAGQQAKPPSAVSFDVLVEDRNGNHVDDIRSDELTVTIDGRPVRIVKTLYVARGPGASDTAVVRAARTIDSKAAAETARTFLLVVDQTTFQPSDEQAVLRASRAFLDRLGLDDRIAIIGLPLSGEKGIQLTTDRVSPRERLVAIAARLRQAVSPHMGVPSDQIERIDPEQVMAARARNDDRQNVAEEERKIAAAEPAGDAPPEDERALRDTVGAIRAILASLSSIPGRKTMVLLSGGLPRARVGVLRSEDVRSAALAAAANRTVLHLLEFRPGRADGEPPDFAPFETLANLTGGSFRVLDRQPDRTIEALVPALSACYKLTVELPATDPSAPGSLKVVTSRTNARVRAALSLPSIADAGDSVVTYSSPIAQSEPAAAASSRPEEARTSNSANAPGEELSLILSKLVDYVDGYQRVFSSVVVKETYSQAARGKRVILDSDFLLVRPADSNQWQSFRDVIAVDGVRVRDRDERLQKLFINAASPDVMTQLNAIKTESARYNIGVERNINVPLFPLAIVARRNLARFRFRLGKTGSTDGVRTQRVEYEEFVKPTLVIDPTKGSDVPVKGWFVVDLTSGAIVETVMDAIAGSMTCHFSVRYKRDDTLGLWVPSDMDESYRASSPVRFSDVDMDAHASYSNFRRFQVTTEEKIAVPKK